MKTIPLSQGQCAIVDDDDFDPLMKFGWYAAWNPNTRSYYAVRNPSVRMNRVIMKAVKGDVVDHINHDTLDNRKDNLRIVTRAQNAMNRLGPNKNSKTGVRGVHWHRESRRYAAEIRVDGRQKHLGKFKTIADAAKAYASANRRYYGEHGGAC